MCVICNLTNQGYETAYLAVQNDSADTAIVPVAVSYTHLTLPTTPYV